MPEGLGCAMHPCGHMTRSACLNFGGSGVTVQADADPESLVHVDLLPERIPVFYGNLKPIPGTRPAVSAGSGSQAVRHVLKRGRRAQSALAAVWEGLSFLDLVDGRFGRRVPCRALPDAFAEPAHVIQRSIFSAYEGRRALDAVTGGRFAQGAPLFEQFAFPLAGAVNGVSRNSLSHRDRLARACAPICVLDHAAERRRVGAVLAPCRGTRTCVGVCLLCATGIRALKAVRATRP
jgi:hypothetical protein